MNDYSNKKQNKEINLKRKGKQQRPKNKKNKDKQPELRNKSKNILEYKIQLINQRIDRKNRKSLMKIKIRSSFYLNRNNPRLKLKYSQKLKKNKTNLQIKKLNLWKSHKNKNNSKQNLKKVNRSPLVSLKRNQDKLLKINKLNLKMIQLIRRYQSKPKRNKA